MTLGQRDRALMFWAAPRSRGFGWCSGRPAARIVGAADEPPPPAPLQSARIGGDVAAEEKSQQAAAGQLAREKGMLQADRRRRSAPPDHAPVGRRAGATDRYALAGVGKTQPLGIPTGKSRFRFRSPAGSISRQFSADVTAQPEPLAAGGLVITPGNDKEKTVNVRLTLAVALEGWSPKRGTASRSGN
jgi:hypothetical protein